LGPGQIEICGLSRRNPQPRLVGATKPANDQWLVSLIETIRADDIDVPPDHAAVAANKPVDAGEVERRAVIVPPRHQAVVTGARQARPREV
jgi:hypothetical protein